MTEPSLRSYQVEDCDSIVDVFSSRLERIAAVRGYKSGWVWHLRGQHWEDVWRATERWRAQ
jgi:hypothetical protein